MAYGIATWSRTPDTWEHEFDLAMITSKTLILSNGEYRRYEEGSPAVVSENVIPVMTSNTAPSGVARASAEYNISYPAWKAFDKESTSESSSAWLTPAGTLTGWLEYEFEEPKVINSYGLFPRENYNRTHAPNTWTFEGSNDGVNYDVLDRRENISNWIFKERKRFYFDNNKEYKIYRINIEKNDGYGTYTAIQELEMFEPHVEAIPPSWETVSTSLPYKQQFEDEGMDDLPSLGRKVQEVLDSPIQMTNTGELGDGKVFKGEVDLKKYFDLRGLEVK